MQTSRKWAAACCGLTLLPAFATTIAVGGLQAAIVATYEFAYKGRPLPYAITHFVASPVVPWVLLAIPTVAVAAFLFTRRPTVESVVLVALGNLVYASLLLLAYFFVGVGCLLTWNAVPLSS